MILEYQRAIYRKVILEYKSKQKELSYLPFTSRNIAHMPRIASTNSRTIKACLTKKYMVKTIAPNCFWVPIDLELQVCAIRRVDANKKNTLDT